MVCDVFVSGLQLLKGGGRHTCLHSTAANMAGQHMRSGRRVPAVEHSAAAMPHQQPCRRRGSRVGQRGQVSSAAALCRCNSFICIGGSRHSPTEQQPSAAAEHGKAERGRAAQLEQSLGTGGHQGDYQSSCHSVSEAAVITLQGLQCKLGNFNFSVHISDTVLPEICECQGWLQTVQGR